MAETWVAGSNATTEVKWKKKTKEGMMDLKKDDETSIFWGSVVGDLAVAKALKQMSDSKSQLKIDFTEHRT